MEAYLFRESLLLKNFYGVGYPVKTPADRRYQGTAPWQLPSLHCKPPPTAIRKLGTVVVAPGCLCKSCGQTHPEADGCVYRTGSCLTCCSVAFETPACDCRVKTEPVSCLCAQSSPAAVTRAAGTSTAKEEPGPEESRVLSGSVSPKSKGEVLEPSGFFIRLQGDRGKVRGGP